MEQDIEQIELSIEEAKKAVDIGKVAQKLANNRDFKKIILEGYFVEEAARLALLSSDPNIPENVRGFIMRDLNGPGALKRYLHTLVTRGRIAESEIENGYHEIENIRQEEGEFEGSF